MSDAANELKRITNANGKDFWYQAEVRHAGLKKYHVLRGKDLDVLKQKARALLARWEELWKRNEDAEAKRQARERQARTKEDKLILADTKTEQAEKDIRELENILNEGISRNIQDCWELLRDNREFSKQKPTEPYLPLSPYVPDPVFPPPPLEPVTPQIPKKPVPPDPSEKASRDDPRFQPVISLVERLIPGQVQKRVQEAEDLFQTEIQRWNQKVRDYNEKVSAHNAYLLGLKQRHKEDKAAYRQRRHEYEEECNKINFEHSASLDIANRQHKEQVERLKANYAESIKRFELERHQYYDDRARRNALIHERLRSISCGQTNRSHRTMRCYLVEFGLSRLLPARVRGGLHRRDPNVDC